MIDLMSAARGAVYRALNDHVAGAFGVFDDVPQGTEPPFLKLGAIDSENSESKTEQLEAITIEVIAVYRGAKRGDLLAMMHKAREALDGATLTAPSANLHQCRFITQSASDAAQDGVTFAGISNFEVLAEAA